MRRCARCTQAVSLNATLFSNTGPLLCPACVRGSPPPVRAAVKDMLQAVSAEDWANNLLAVPQWASRDTSAAENSDNHERMVRAIDALASGAASAPLRSAIRAMLQPADGIALLTANDIASRLATDNTVGSLSEGGRGGMNIVSLSDIWDTVRRASRISGDRRTIALTSEGIVFGYLDWSRDFRTASAQSHARSDRWVYQPHAHCDDSDDYDQNETYYGYSYVYVYAS